MRHDELTKTIFQAFDWLNEDLLTKRHERWKPVLKLIVAGKGTNEMVELHHGLKSKLEHDLPTIPEDSDTERKEIKAMLDTVGKIDGF